MWVQYICITNNIGTTEIQKIYYKMSSKHYCKKCQKCYYRTSNAKADKLLQDLRENMYKGYKHNSDG